MRESRFNSKGVISFNSTLVRFKLGSGPAIVSEDIMFQFHIGSIQAPSPGYAKGNAPQFQFHIGSIQARREWHESGRCLYVSIPHWFDSSLARL